MLKGYSKVVFLSIFILYYSIALFGNLFEIKFTIDDIGRMLGAGIGYLILEFEKKG